MPSSTTIIAATAAVIAAVAATSSITTANALSSTTGNNNKVTPPSLRTHRGNKKPLRTSTNTMMNTAVVAAAQFKSLDGPTPAATIAANANLIASIAINAATANANNNQSATALMDLITFPEFNLFGSSDWSSSTTSCVKSDIAKRSELFSQYCEDIPAAGTLIDCTAADSATVPYKIIGCGLMGYGNFSNAGDNILTSQLAVSYNTCQRNRNSTDPNAIIPSFYNAQVVVGAGQILAVYYKYHPFMTNCFDTPPLELVTFNTIVSNMTFGLFTCFDILFPQPKDELVKNGVKYFSYSAAYPWVFKTVMEIFSGGNNVTVVASNQNGQSTVIVDGKAVGIVNGSSNGGGCPDTVGDEPCVAWAELPL